MMRLAVTGFVSEQAGSMASANALLLRELLQRDCEVDFFSKASFVDPRPVAGGHPGFRFTNVDNRLADRLRTRLERIPIAGKLAGMVDAATYNRLLVRRINEAHRERKFDLCLWLGDYARGRVGSIPTVSFVQGAPGSDARSVLRRFQEIKLLAGAKTAWKWKLLAHLRLAHPGLPPFHFSDRFLVGSNQSKNCLHEFFGIAKERIDPLPYPIDLQHFSPLSARPHTSTLHCLWLGRIVPRKRLDLFLEGAAEAIGRGVDVQLTVIGSIGFIPGYEKLLQNFPHPDRLTWQKFLPRKDVPGMLAAHDVLAQPSEEEDFGSSVAEAQACGLPVIVGTTNGNADYLCPRDIHLRNDSPATLADALVEMANRKETNRWGEASESRAYAENHFSLNHVASALRSILNASANHRD